MMLYFPVFVLLITKLLQAHFKKKADVLGKIRIAIPFVPIFNIQMSSLTVLLYISALYTNVSVSFLPPCSSHLTT